VIRNLSEVGRLTRVLVKRPREAFVDEATIAAEWKALGFAADPQLPDAIDEYEAFLETVRTVGAQIDFLPRDARTNLDSI
jgi:arginine deiminase